LQISISGDIRLAVAKRDALLISCSLDEAKTIRKLAAAQRRTISGYVLNIVMRKVEIEEGMFRRHQRLATLQATVRWRLPGPRTTMILRCARQEAMRIRTAARRRDITISRFVLDALEIAWAVADRLAKRSKLFEESQ
jgi:uncharacterized protein (DUF1778 family)